ncbi:unnamed protein product [Dovyalis caffra]|uniref:Uncharacterized protein n=1 Tax=Dovyalis caffra TaxID=77055 RepID=A0AAV1QVJ2_9ROSI|nr:unnamed protein product [Dovyalis caffra]
MMMSMFSSFDALSAETFGQKLKFSFSTPKEGNKPGVEPMKKSGMSEGNKDKSSTSPPENINKSSQQQKRRPRFAPELDGMAMGAVSVTVPAIVAAAGIYFLDKSHSKAQELGSRMRASRENMVEKVKKASEMPKLAPQLDGLNCFETLICH